METCESSDGALEDIPPHHSPGKGNEKGCKRDGHKGNECVDEAGCADGLMTATGAIGIRDSSKRTADSAGLNEGGESAHRSEKVRRAGECVGFHCRGRV